MHNSVKQRIAEKVTWGNVGDLQHLKQILIEASKVVGNITK